MRMVRVLAQVARSRAPMMAACWAASETGEISSTRRAGAQRAQDRRVIRGQERGELSRPARAPPAAVWPIEDPKYATRPPAAATIACKMPSPLGRCAVSSPAAKRSSATSKPTISSLPTLQDRPMPCCGRPRNWRSRANSVRRVPQSPGTCPGRASASARRQSDRAGRRGCPTPAVRRSPCRR